jgi:SAM-dependent methyltransferase
MVPSRTRRRTPRGRPGVPASLRRRWGRTYATTSYRDLPWFSPRPSSWIERGVHEGWIARRSRVLDVGCGAGTNSLFLARAGFRVSGIDLAPAAIEAARRRAARAGLAAEFRVSDALRLPFRSRSFGGLVDMGCFHTIPVRLRRAYSTELGRVLRPGGRYLVSWVGREATQKFGPPHRPSVEETALAFEREFLFLRTEFEPARRRFSGYHALLERRASPQPPPR